MDPEKEENRAQDFIEYYLQNNFKQKHRSIREKQKILLEIESMDLQVGELVQNICRIKREIEHLEKNIVLNEKDVLIITGKEERVREKNRKLGRKMSWYKEMVLGQYTYDSGD